MGADIAVASGARRWLPRPPGWAPWAQRSGGHYSKASAQQPPRARSRSPASVREHLDGAPRPIPAEPQHREFRHTGECWLSDRAQAAAERQRTENSISVADAEAVRQAVADEVRDLQHSDSPSSGLTKEAAERVVSIVDVHISELIEKARRRQLRD